MLSQQERTNEHVVIEIYDINLQDGRVLHLTNNNKNVTYKGNIYIAYPISRDQTKQDTGDQINDLSITLGDKDNMLTREILSYINIIKNAEVTIFRGREATTGNNNLGFVQVFTGKIKTMGGSPGIVNFTLVEPFSDPQKPINNKKFGEIAGMIDVYKRIY